MTYKALKPSRRSVLATTLGGVAMAGGFGAARAESPDTTNLAWRSVFDIAADIQAGKFQPREVVEYFLARARTLDRQLHAFRILDVEGALAQVERLSVSADMPLAGVPIAVDQTLAVKGWPVLGPNGRERIAQADHVAVSRLRAAGAILIGSTVSESLEGPFGYALTARVANPWRLDRSAGASSAGAAAAVAAAMVPLSVGVDGAGGARLPAAQCGVVAMAMPSLDADRGQLLAAAALLGADPFLSDAGPTLASTGAVTPIAREVADAALLMAILNGGHTPAAPQGRSGALRIGWSDGVNAAAGSATAVVRHAVVSARPLGATVEDVGALQASPWESDPLTARLGGSHPPAWPTGEALIADCRARRAAGDAMAALFDRYDVLAMPTTPLSATALGARQAGRGTYTGSAHLASWLGLPAITVPVGLDRGLPVGLQLVARSGDEGLLLQAAEGFLARAPRMLPPIG